MIDAREHRGKLTLHVFIQFLAHEGVLNEWLDEMLTENPAAGFYTNDRVQRVQQCTYPNSMINQSFGLARSKMGGDFWNIYADKWKIIHRRIVRNLRGET